MNTPTCPYCNATALHHATSEHIYRGQNFGAVWQCSAGCDAYVGCHPDGSPKGRLANKALRKLKMDTHYYFDPLWLDWKNAYPDASKQYKVLRDTMRRRAYEWLAEELQIPFDECHIGMFDDDRCVRAIEILRTKKPTAAGIRAWANERKKQSVAA